MSLVINDAEPSRLRHSGGVTVHIAHDCVTTNLHANNVLLFQYIRTNNTLINANIDFSVQ